MMSVVIGDIIGDDGVIGNDGNNHTGALFCLLQRSRFLDPRMTPSRESF